MNLSSIQRLRGWHLVGAMLLSATAYLQGAEWSASFETEALSGAFEVEAELESSDGLAGLAIVQLKDGKPDLENYTAIVVDRSHADGIVRVRLNDKQNGEANVLDNTGSMMAGYGYYEKNEEAARAATLKRYEHKIERSYSRPFDEIDGRLKIVRDAKAGFFHYYYGYTTVIEGQELSGWMALAPSKDWAAEGTEYCLALLKKGEAEFSNAEASHVRWKDKVKQNGFTLKQRPFTWSGNTGDGWVITFDQERVPESAKGAKFVFWSLANYVPTWCFSNQLLYTYEFIETWDKNPVSGHHGCFEPMSDRLYRFSKVTLLEDSAVRKVLKWEYALMNPDYTFPRMGEGEQVPMVEELWTIYPDATGVRHITYWPKLDSAHRMWHELAELIVIAGTLTDPVDHIASPAVSILNLEGAHDTFLPHPDGSFNHRDYEPWKQIISVAHFKKAPDAYIAFSQDKRAAETFPNIPFGVDVSWHTTDDRMCHWPVGLEPYQGPDKSHANWSAQVSHTSIAGVGIFEGDTWEDRYQVDANGRRFRTWTAAIGLTNPKSLDEIRHRVSGWIKPAKIKSLRGAKHLGYDYQSAAHQLKASDGRRVQLSLRPDDAVIRNPVFEIAGVDAVDALTVSLNDQPYRDFKYSHEDGALVVWVAVTSDTSIDLEFNF